MSVHHPQARISDHPSRIRRPSFATNGKVLPRDAQTKGCVPLSADLCDFRRCASPQEKKSLHGIWLCRFHVDAIVATLLIARHHLVLQRRSRHLPSASQQPVLAISVVQKQLACPTQTPPSPRDFCASLPPCPYASFISSPICLLSENTSCHIQPHNQHKSTTAAD